MKKSLLFVLLTTVVALVLAACGGQEAAAPIVVTKEVIVEKEVIKEVPVDRIVTTEVVKEVQVMVPGETLVVEKEVVVIKEVRVEKVVDREVVRIVEVEKLFASFGESPALAQRVQAGKLPPVNERLPKQPMLIPVFGEIGKYGGTMRRFYLGPADGCNFFRVSKASLARFSLDGFSLVPAVAKGWDPSADGKEWTFQLREGMRWSDGAPFTADDFVFQYQNVILNEDLTPRPPNFLKVKDQFGKVEKIDDFTVKIVYPFPNFLTLEAVAQGDEACYGAGRNVPWNPAHYMKQFHKSFNPNADELAKAEGLEDWVQLYDDKVQYNLNPDKPSIAPWKLTSPLGGQLVTSERNAYFWGVDPKGNQLPYIDAITLALVDNPSIGTLKSLAGEIDAQGRHIQLPDYVVLKEGEEKGGYEVVTWPSFGGTEVSVRINPGMDGAAGEALSNKTFRQALSVAIDRDFINEIDFLGLGIPRQDVPKNGHPDFPGVEWEQKYVAYDPAMAMQMLDSVFPNKNADGHRLASNGEVIVVDVGATPAFGPWPDAAEQIAGFWEDVGVKSEAKIFTRSLLGTKFENGELGTQIWVEDRAGFLFSGFANYGLFSPSYIRWVNTDGAEGKKPPQEQLDLFALHGTGATLPEKERRALAQKLWADHVENMWSIGTVGASPMLQGVIVVRNDLKNFPRSAGNDWPLRTPNTGFPEQWFFSK